MEKLSVTQYATKRGIKRQYILRCLKNGRTDLLRNVRRAEKIGNNWLIYFSEKKS